MKTFTEQAKIYAQYHQKRLTLYTHFVGIPLLIFGLMIFLGFVKLIVPGVISTTLASIATLILFIYYLCLKWQLALLLAPILVFMLWLSHFISDSGPTSFALWVFVSVFVLGLVLQLLGHLLEGRKPALTHSITQLYIAPLFLVAELCFMAGRMQTLKEQVHGVPHTLESID